MGANRIRRLPVMDAEGKMSGMVSLGDLARKLNSCDVGEVLAKISQ
jgi:CBS domain-containing protein